MKQEQHFINRSGWLRAAVLGANDGILSTTALAIGVATASATREPILLATVAGLVAGALSMATGEYISVSSQADIEKGDLAREKVELQTMPDEELEELTLIYKSRGLDYDLAKQVAIQLTQHNALETHARDELGINDITQAKPLQAAVASAAAFSIGGLLPLLIVFLMPLDKIVLTEYIFSLLFLAISGAVAAKAGGSNIKRAVIRITIGGTFAMGMAALIGHLFGTAIN